MNTCWVCGDETDEGNISWGCADEEAREARAERETHGYDCYEEDGA